MPYKFSKKKVIGVLLLELVCFLFFFLRKIIRRKKVHSHGNQNILLIEPFQMGDVLSLTPLVSIIKNNYPQYSIYVLTKPTSGSILSYDSRFKEILCVNFFWSDYDKKITWRNLVNFFRDIKKLKSYSFAIGIDTRGDIRSQITLNILDCSEIIAYKNYLHSNINVQGLLATKSMLKSIYKHRYLWNIQLLQLIGINPPTKIQFPSFLPDKLTLSEENSKFILIHIGGGWIYKRWSIENWILLIERLLGNLSYDLKVVAGMGEKQILEQIQNNFLNNARVHFEVTSIERLISLTYHCSLFVGLDSGPMNLAVCLNKPVIALFGPGDSEMWFPLNDNSLFIHKKESFSCNPCLQTVCYFPHRNCMSVINVDEVVQIILDKCRNDTN